MAILSNRLFILSKKRKSTSTSHQQKFDNLLKSVFQVKRFEQFLRKEMSVENLLFFQDVLAFKNGKISAHDIFQTYISRNASLQINISDQTRRELCLIFNENPNLSQSSTADEFIFRSYNSNAQSISSQRKLSCYSTSNTNKTLKNSTTIFDNAVEQIYRLLLNDSFQRFHVQNSTTRSTLFNKNIK
jgi:hypothetical protein